MSGFHSIFNTHYTKWVDLEKSIETILDNTEKGNIFEQFVYFYLLYHKDIFQIKELYTDKVFNKKIPKEVRNAIKLEPNDHGVDGVFISIDDSITAYQAKFRSNRGYADGGELSTFWAEAEYADYRCIISNGTRLPLVAYKKKNQTSILADSFDKLSEDFFTSLHNYVIDSRNLPIIEKKKPRDYQEIILKDIVLGFESNDRGKLVSACGSGKTLIALWVKEYFHANKCLFVAPSLLLIRQTLQEWATNKNLPFSYLCVCSDNTINEDIENDEFDIDLNEIDIPVTTSEVEVVRFLAMNLDKPIVVFSTYQSLDVVTKAIVTMKKFRFDITFFDEAHRTAGVKNSSMFGIGLHDTNIPSNKRLFMTATERLIKPWIIDKVESTGQVVFSMDNEDIYGPVFSKLTFGKAIRDKIISDYEIIVAGITEGEINQLVKSNNYLTIENEKNENQTVAGFELFKATLINKIFNSLQIKKLVSFHSSVKKGKEFAQIMNFIDTSRNTVGYKNVYSNINGGQTSTERSEIIQNFEEANLGVLTNVRCLTEGVDLPYIDGIFFSEPKNSIIDIVQATGRALRKPYDDNSKIAYIIFPIVLPDSDETLINIKGDQFDAFHNVIQALRDNDETLAEWIDSINLGIAKGGFATIGKKSSKLHFLLPKAYDLEKFKEAITYRIAEINRNPIGQTGLGSKLGKHERKTTFLSVFNIIGDYNYDKYQTSLVDPTIKLFENENKEKLRNDLKLNNNNISHTERIGIIYQYEKNKFLLTSIGKKYYLGKISFEDLFKNQLLQYSIKDKSGHSIMFPYREAFKIISEVKTLNYFEFLFGLYSLQSEIDTPTAYFDAIERIMLIRNNFPNLSILNESNKKAVEEQLNALHPVGFSTKEIWTDRTAIGNRYRYFCNHLNLFNDLFRLDLSSKTISLLPESESKIIEVLEKSKPKGNFEDSYGYHYWI